MLAKHEKLIEILKEYKSLAVAFSGGVDSTYLLKAAKEALGDRVLAVTAVSNFFPEAESREAREFCEQNGIRQIVIRIDEADIEGFADNPKNRCYICKKHIFTEIKNAAKANSIEYVAEASNMDDNGDYRPGMIAIKELMIESPLRKAELYKSEIRELSKDLGLKTWDKPSFACLASRFVYGEKITKEKLLMVEGAEKILFELGFKQFRVRIHGDLARIEVLDKDIERLMEQSIRCFVFDELKKLGFTYITVDMFGYRTGSMNETLSQDELEKGKNVR